jgi:putative transposase
MSQVITGVLIASAKNETIKASLKATKARRKRQRCRVFEVKLDSSHLNQHTKAQLQRLFLEAKWLYNYILSQPDVFALDYKLATVPVKVKDVFELRELRYLSSHMKQSLIKRTIDNIEGLAH